MRTSVHDPRQRFTASDITDTKRGHVSSSDARCGAACRRTRLLLTVSVLVLLVLAAVQLAVTVWHQPTQNLTCPPLIVPRQPPCQALPLGLPEHHPDCANALLEVMNVTNVRVLRFEKSIGHDGGVEQWSRGECTLRLRQRFGPRRGCGDCRDVEPELTIGSDEQSRGGTGHVVNRIDLQVLATGPRRPRCA